MDLEQVETYTSSRRKFLKGGVTALGLAALGGLGGQFLFDPTYVSADTTLPRIYVSSNARFLMTEQQQPFFWLADTAWELFHRLTRSDIDTYLTNRSQKGFNMIEAVVLAEFDGLHTPNREGQTPLVNDDPTQPNEAYFQLVDYVIASAQAKGLYIGLLPTWGDKVYLLWGIGPVIFNVSNAYTYGKFLGQRYMNATNIIWILGGDRNPDNGTDAVWRSMASGIQDGVGDSNNCLMTYHPQNGNNSGQWFQGDAWFDSNMLQSGHWQYDTPNWDEITTAYNQTPTKPILDGEPNYEDSPMALNPANGYFTDYDARKAAYRSVFAGAFGHTFGNHCIWQFYQPGYDSISSALYYWYDAIDHPGAGQMQYVRNLMLARPFFSRIPDQGLLASDAGSGSQHVQATRSADGSYAFVYIPTANYSVSINMDRISGPVQAWWYDPRTGVASSIGQYSNSGTQTFTTSSAGPDWVLVLDDQTQNFPPPGPTSGSTSTNVLQDPGFESQSSGSVTTPWFTDGNPGIDYQNGKARSGQNNGYIGNAPANTWSAINQNVTLQSNTNYSLSCWIRTVGAASWPGGNIGIITPDRSFQYSQSFGPQSNYTQINVPVFNTGNNTNWTVFIGYGGGLNTWAQIDDCSLVMQ